MKNIILASSSPRRIQMMKNHSYEPEICPADVDETLPMKMSPESSVMYLAMKKASFIDNKTEAKHLIIAADTIVVYKNQIIGKPANKNEAYEILNALNGNCHYVITGVCIIDTYTYLKTCFYEKTAVYFKSYSHKELNDYVNTEEPYDKAGGYAIQGTFAKYIDHIDGDYDNVVGFPWYKIEPYLL